MASLRLSGAVPLHIRTGIYRSARRAAVPEQSALKSFMLSSRQFHTPKRSLVKLHRGPYSPAQRIRMRYASTAAASGSTSLPTNAGAAQQSGQSATPSDWAMPFDELGVPAASIEPHIGYLKELGLDYGWGPTAVVQWAFEHLQVNAGLSLVGAALGVTLIVRMIVLPLAIDASDMAARTKVMNPRLKPLTDKMLQASAAGDQAAALAARVEVQHIRKEAGLKIGTMFWPLLVQAPLGFGLFRLTRGMADVHVPGMDTAGFAWISHLGLPDPYYTLPAASAAMIYLTMKRGLQDNAPSPFAETIVKVLPFITLGAMSWLPALTQVGFAAAGAIQFIQAEVLRMPRIRKWLSIHPMVDSSQVSTGAYQGRMTTEESQSKVSEEEATGLQRIMKAPGSAYSSLKKTASDYVDRATAAKTKKEGRLTAAELKQAENYEAMRRKEESQRQWQRKAKDDERRRRSLR